MQPPPPPLHIPQSSKSVSQKRALMEPDVIEISPPPMISRSNRVSNKLKQVVLREVIDVDNDEDSSDCMIIDATMDTKNKGKAIEESVDDYLLAKDAMVDYLPYPSKGSGPGSQKTVIVDGSNSDMLDNECIDITSDDFMDFDEYAYLQAHFDNVDIPPGVEVPIPCLLDSLHKTKKTVNESDSLDTTNQKNLNNLVAWSSKSSAVGKKLGFKVTQDSVSHASGVDVSSHWSFVSHASGADLSSHWSFSQTAQIKKKPTVSQLGYIMNPTAIQKIKIPVHSSSPIIFSPVNQLHKAAIPFPDEPSYQGGPTNPFFPSFPSHVGGLNHPASVGPPFSWPLSEFKSSFVDHTSHSEFYNPLYGGQNLSEEGVARTLKHVNEDDILSKYQNFKRFDTVEDHSDHHYASKGSSVKQPPKNWAKKIQEEWRILENDLPDGIFVRIYESRMDLLRAVIIGAEGTPYHDGLFFFDVFFPSGYPNIPPNVYYHSGGLRLNPNLYNCGKVCLSLLGTWHGNKNEKWLPGVSTVLQVLVSIQALILNQKPYFNEPGYAHMNGSAHGEIQSQQYNERTFILSLKTMVYTMRRPPKHFEDFVLGHFHKHAHDILVACKAYMDGAQVGCLVKGGVQDVDEGDKSCSKSFKDSLPGCVDLLLKEFSLIGVKDTEKYQILVKGDIKPSA
ncbi:probable ubiquitin-conjugating enzyme E2 26 isoform X2 [Ricinus communis]|uniref:probable ubiquitin-conjugating enzyme E2 26 isoform X2 n=1 Tax=Ricinus communis TaxID=3988 RepID=UPI00077279F0|nr:probable ubiquitin-conjugating enzyme E2 26 isoform X2 [Ricinus communis]|eukprot:XP_015582419.1 probable ubiquitin-conjugating enzyme E2 26 isoform X2 [Ricinus communis]